MNVKIPNILIKGVAGAIPKNQLTLSSLGDEFSSNEVNRIISSTGIKSVRVGLNGMTSADLCHSAALNLLSELAIVPQEIDAIIFVSQTPEAVMPATSIMLQHRLGLATTAVAFDINYGCSGYIYGLYQAAMLLNGGGCKKVLLCAGDVITPLLHTDDRHLRMVLGDAGSATLLEKGDNDLHFVLRTDGSGAKHLMVPSTAPNMRQYIQENQISSPNLAVREGYLYMNGSEIMTFALREVPLVIDELLISNEWQRDNVNLFVLHQANQFMLDYLRKKLRVNKEKVPTAVENTGNTGPASIPLTLSLMNEQLKQQSLERVIMCGFGVGLSWGAVSANLTDAKILAPIEL